MWISNDLARIVECGESLPDEFIETERLGPSNFNVLFSGELVAILQSALATSSAGHRLEKNRRQVNFVIQRGFVGDPFGEFKELSRMDDRVRERAFLD